MTAKNDKKVDGAEDAQVATTAGSAKRQEQIKETEELLEHAKGKQKQRLDALKKAPASAPMVMERDEREELARYFVPEAFIHEKKENWRKRGTRGEYMKGSTKTCSWSDNTDQWRRKMSDKGYLPVLDDGIQVSDGGGDILWEAPIEFAKAKIKRAREMHVQRIQDEGKKYERETVAGGGGVGKDNSLTFEQGD